jgi:hypothetical protein
VSKHVMHAAKIPESIQARSKQTRLSSGDGYVNACDDKPWQRRPADVPFMDVEPCAACRHIVEVNRQVKAGDKPRT